jgi:hypothetical protein
MLKYSTVANPIFVSKGDTLMARKKRTSSAIDKAEIRTASLKSIDIALDLGNDLTLIAYDAKISDVQAKLDEYNTKLSELDALLNDLQAAEKELNSLSTDMLAGVKLRFGSDSNEYGMAGGTRTSDITRRSSVPEPTPA